MPIKEIKHYAELRAAGDSTLSDRMEMLVQHRQALNEQIAQLQEHKIKLDEKIEFYRNEIERTQNNFLRVCQKICVSKLSENFLWTAWLTCSKCWKPVKVRGSAFTGFRHFDKIHHCSPEDLHT